MISRATRRRVPYCGVLLGTALTLAASLPQARAARGQQRAVSRPAAAAERSALTGGVVRLRAPGSTMLRIPASTFRMGSTELEVVQALADCRRARTVRGRAGAAPHAGDWPACRTDRFAIELPRHRVRLSSFWLDRTEVTVADYEQCVRLRRCEPIPYAQGGRRFAQPTFPASLVDWSQASAYCRFRGARLPTEAEFERAARGVTRRRYPWGELYNSRACNHGRLGWRRTDATDGFAELAPVGSFPAGQTPEGFLDLAGNVSEWVSDTFEPEYPAQPVVDPSGPTATRGLQGTSPKVFRGGDYESAAPFLRGAARFGADPTVRVPTLGFRCARSAAAR